MSSIPSLRIRDVNEQPVREDGDYVLYWMIAFRRCHWNFSLERAIEWCSKLKKPLVVFEPLRCGYEWASDRLHRFVLQGMADNRNELTDKQARYYAYVEPEKGAGQGLLEALAEKACLVVTDDYPCFFLPRMVEAAGEQLPVRVEAVDSNGLLPMRAADKVFARAHDFRRYLQKNLASHLTELPKTSPFQGYDLPEAPQIPRSILDRWPEATDALLTGNREHLKHLPIDHDIGPADFNGGAISAGDQLQSFLKERLSHYAEGRNHPDDDASSGLSPYLHFGQISVHEIFACITERENWSPAALGGDTKGSREGWWGMSPESESFLDELITWRELGFNRTWQTDNFHLYSSLPDWAQTTLAEHADDPREYVYSMEEFESAKTHDDLWNAAQRQLVTEGRMHNYLRMLWGKKILEWSPSPEEALETMIHLNNKYAVDGRDPNSYSGIFWVLGRYDRAWGPERAIYGKVRYMSSENTRRKLHLDNYLKKYGSSASR
ncbi:MAG: deoxyribodipyrimidine photolyase [Planctomycetaceae bacterium]|nr:deoxyribodipyrimidine photolyase [Planctomycetaceae bacterium]